MNLAGYTYLIEELELTLPPLGLELAQGNKTVDEVRSYGSTRIKLLSNRKKVGDTIYEHLETAIQYQGIRLAYLLPILEKLNKKDLSNFIRERHTSNVRRCIWYLYEWLLDDRLDIEDSKANYTPLLDERFYYTSSSGVRDQRTRVINNLIGNKSFSPMIRKTSAIKKCAQKDFMQIAREKLFDFNEVTKAEILGRSVEYLYTKETRSSTEIEKESPPEDKLRRFYRVLKTSGSIPLSKRRLINIQNEIVKSEKKDNDYRDDEIFVGETRLTWQDGLEENIHYIGPRKEQVPDMMKGLLDMHKAILLDNTLPPMMHAAIISFGFVYIHPFSDGNGRIHRYLIHDVLKSRRTINDDFIIPVSATILMNIKDYDRVLETISEPVMAMIDYDLNDEDFSITINNDIQHFYRYPDLTAHVEFLYNMMETSISEDLLHEVWYLFKFDAVKKAIEENFDIPNKELNLFIKLALQNDGKIGLSKRKRFQKWISEEDLIELEKNISLILADIKQDQEQD